MITIVGAGGVGQPALMGLARAGIRAVRVVDDDHVDVSNLHRQILFREEQVGMHKLDALVSACQDEFPMLRVDVRKARVRPDTGPQALEGASLIIDASDNFPTRFLLSDLARSIGVPIVHAAAVRWVATVLAVAPEGAPCYRCVFEDVPDGPAPDCATAGVAGPVCGVAGGLAAEAALAVMAAGSTSGKVFAATSAGPSSSPFGSLVTFDGRRDEIRRHRFSSRKECGCAA